MSDLHHVVLSSRAPATGRCILMLHGMLGSGSNLRSLANALLADDPGAQCVLPDLPMHGRSQSFKPPYNVDACARALVRLSRSLSTPPTEVIGHSFGGKVALSFAREQPSLQRIVLIDSSPFVRPARQGSEQTLAVLQLLEGLPAWFETRGAFVQRVQDHGFSPMIAAWLAMNLERDGNGFRLRLELSAIRALLDDYFARDLWDVIETTGARVDLVIGGRSSVWDADDLARARTLEAEAAGRVRVRVLPEAGHWVHVDDPPGLLLAITSGRAKAAAT